MGFSYGNFAQTMMIIDAAYHDYESKMHFDFVLAFYCFKISNFTRFFYSYHMSNKKMAFKNVSYLSILESCFFFLVLRLNTPRIIPFWIRGLRTAAVRRHMGPAVLASASYCLQ